ncbi:chloride channel protein [Aureibacter tunicatorum]|uniref:CIC family chloride channel protein n=1 Tax=Aureibacter tunicatorum TaxID=866807 RepID=A0AAE4BRB9_9BACT|nr:chloride channel protein [Aureibacter tunicatorum]MDR6237610.1 CIC family chloride channel protein [Aureibacter tunicatorum]BDD02644.1 chloride channel protein [Aureibacter tunicatorum]
MLKRFLFWRVKHINNKNFTLLVSGVVGVLAGLAAVVLKESVHFIHNWLQSDTDNIWDDWRYIFFPSIGIILTVILSRYVVKEKLGHGVSGILYNISQKSSKVPPKKQWTSLVFSAITVGFGGSVGLESPIVVTGSAIGSNIGRITHLDYNRRSLLIGCGAAGAISSIFYSPIAGVIFAIECILADVSISSFIPLLISSVCGALVSLGLLGSDVLFSFKLQDPFAASDTPLYILLGVISGFVSLYFTRVTYYVEPRIKRIKNYLLRALIAGLSIGILVFVLPSLYGEGYDSIKMLLNGNALDVFGKYHYLYQGEFAQAFIILSLLAIILLKPVATSLTIGGGGCGGVFAPSMFLGGVTGFFVALTTNFIAGENIASLSNFTLVGMCGVMAGVLHAPLTGIFLIAEITGGYTLFLPLMLVSAISFSTISYFEKYSIYTKKLIERGQLFQDDKDGAVLDKIQLQKIVERDLKTIKSHSTLGDLVELVKVSKRNIFPVIDEEGQLLGIITLDDIREKMFDEEKRCNLVVNTIMHKPPATISPDESMKSAINKFQRTGSWNLPVIKDGKYYGIISKSGIFNAYRNKLKKKTIIT